MQYFGAQCPGLTAGCLRFARAVARQDVRLASGCWPSSTGWDWLPTGLLRKVSGVAPTSFLLPQASPGAIASLHCNELQCNGLQCNDATMQSIPSALFGVVSGGRGVKNPGKTAFLPRR